MRSRDGNHSFSLRLCSIIFLCSLALNAGEYLISYRYVVKNATIYNEHLSISHSMSKCKGSPYNPLILENNGSHDLKSIIYKNNEKFINYIHKLGLNISHKESTTNYQNSSTTILTLKTKCFKVDFNDNFARISPLK